MFGDDVIGDGVSGDEMFLNDALEDGWVAGVIPSAFGVDECDGALLADAEAVGFGAEGPAGADEAELGEAAFEVSPGFEGTGFVAAFGLGLIAAEKDVALGFRHADGGGDAGEAVWGWG